MRRLDMSALYEEHGAIYSSYQGIIPDEFLHFPKNGVTAYYLTDSKTIRSVVPCYNPFGRLEDSHEVTDYWIYRLARFVLLHKRLVVRCTCRGIENEQFVKLFKSQGRLEIAPYYNTVNGFQVARASKDFCIGRKCEGKPNFLMRTVITNYPAIRFKATEFSLRDKNGFLAVRENEMLKASIKEDRNDLITLGQIEWQLCEMLLDHNICRSEVAYTLGLVSLYDGSMHRFNYLVSKIIKKFEEITGLSGYSIEEIAKYLDDFGLL